LSSSHAADSAQSAVSYLAKAANGDLFEILSSQAIEASTHNSAIKDFARTMVSAHQQSTRNSRPQALKPA
jgi:putative membrane protein